MKSQSDKAIVSASKLLSLILRHQPDIIGLKLDSSGWVDVDELLTRIAASGRQFDRALLEEVVATSDKKRFAFSKDGTRIRANQGHSVQVELGLAERRPPDQLYHGTATRFLDSIRSCGLVSGKRHHVHLSQDPDTARTVGSRHGQPVVLAVDSKRMSADGYKFCVSENHVWLTETVPPGYLSELDN